MALADFVFDYRILSDEHVVVTFKGKPVTTLRGMTAARFLADVEAAAPLEQQLAMAKITGRFKHGNERVAKRHPRNRGAL